MEVAHVELGARCPPECRHLDLLQLGLLQALRLGPPVLEPNLDLGLGEPQRRAKLGPLRYAEVLLLAELLLERQQLLGGERCAGLPVRFVLPQIALDTGRFVICNKRREHI